MLPKTRIKLIEAIRRGTQMDIVDYIEDNFDERIVITDKYRDEVMRRISLYVRIEYGITEEQLFSKCRKREIVLSRQLTMYFSGQMLEPMALVGQYFNGDHVTVINAKTAITHWLLYPEYAKRFAMLKDLINKETGYGLKIIHYD